MPSRNRLRRAGSVERSPWPRMKRGRKAKAVSPRAWAAPKSTRSARTRERARSVPGASGASSMTHSCGPWPYTDNELPYTAPAHAAGSARTSARIPPTFTASKPRPSRSICLVAKWTTTCGCSGNSPAGSVGSSPATGVTRGEARRFGSPGTSARTSTDSRGSCSSRRRMARPTKPVPPRRTMRSMPVDSLTRCAG